MKLELNIDEKVKETLVVVSANKIDKEVPEFNKLYRI